MTYPSHMLNIDYTWKTLPRNVKWFRADGVEGLVTQIGNEYLAYAYNWNTDQSHGKTFDNISYAQAWIEDICWKPQLWQTTSGHLTQSMKAALIVAQGDLAYMPLLLSRH